jgi:hypothetical protein
MTIQRDLINGSCTLYSARRSVVESLRRQRQFSWYEILDHFHFGPLFSGDDAGFVRERFCTRRVGNNRHNESD